MASDEKTGEGIASLKKWVYAISDVGKQADGYTKTTKAIADYAGRVYGHEMKQLILLGKEAELVEPVYPSSGSEGDKAIWSKRYDQYLRKKDRYDDHRAKVFTIIMGQCDKPMQNRVESMSAYEAAMSDNDVVALLRVIKDIAFDSDERKYPSMQVAIAWRNLVKAWPQDGEGLNDYYKQFQSLVELVERAYGPVAPLRVARRNGAFR